MKELPIALSIVAMMALGCGKEEAKPKSGVEINAPGVNIKAGDGGTQISASGVDVKVKQKDSK